MRVEYKDDVRGVEPFDAYTLKYIYYEPGELAVAVAAMPDYELWDSKRRVLGKELGKEDRKV